MKKFFSNCHLIHIKSKVRKNLNLCHLLTLAPYIHPSNKFLIKVLQKLLNLLSNLESENALAFLKHLVIGNLPGLEKYILLKKLLLMLCLFAYINDSLLHLTWFLTRYWYTNGYWFSTILVQPLPLFLWT